MTISKQEQQAFSTTAEDDRIAAQKHDVSDQATSPACDTPKSNASADEPSYHGDHVARVIAVDRDQYIVRNDRGEIPAELTGRFFYACESRADFPCVGDWVAVRYHDSGTRASIHNILPRTSFLRRKSPGKSVEFQMIAANIDAAFIVQSCHFDFNIQRLERYLVMVKEGQIEPVILLTKTDLISPESLEKLIDKIRHAGIRAQIVAVCNMTGLGLDQVRELLLPEKTYCLLGSSGVGKTTLINCLLGSSESPAQETGEVSHTGEGRHTTTRRQLVALEHGALLIDMPGMRELGMLGVGQGIDDSFDDIQAYSKRCRFVNCSHTNEPGCAVQGAIEHDELDAAHLQNYLKLKKESEFHEMSYLEKRKKDRAFGLRVRSVKRAKIRGNRD